MTINKTESNEGHDKQDYMPSNDKHQDTIPHLTPKHDNGHIHQASPISGLPLESLLNNITMASNQQLPDELTPPKPLDTCKGPEAVMQAINK